MAAMEALAYGRIYEGRDGTVRRVWGWDVMSMGGKVVRGWVSWIPAQEPAGRGGGLWDIHDFAAWVVAEIKPDGTKIAMEEAPAPMAKTKAKEVPDPYAARTPVED